LAPGWQFLITDLCPSSTPEVCLSKLPASAWPCGQTCGLPTSRRVYPFRWPVQSPHLAALHLAGQPPGFPVFLLAYGTRAPIPEHRHYRSLIEDAIRLLVLARSAFQLLGASTVKSIPHPLQRVKAQDKVLPTEPMSGLKNHKLQPRRAGSEPQVVVWLVQLMLEIKILNIFGQIWSCRTRPKDFADT
jgi:hypothetical protein